MSHGFDSLSAELARLLRTGDAEGTRLDIRAHERRTGSGLGNLIGGTAFFEGRLRSHRIVQLADRRVRSGRDASFRYHRPRFLPAAAMLFIFGIDGLMRFTSPPLIVAAALDETAHLTTATILLKALPLPSNQTYQVSALLTSVLIDLDHIPLLLGSSVLTEGTSRPYGHTLLCVVAALCFTLGKSPRRRNAALGAASGLLLHFVRDVVKGNGLAFFWPITRASIRAPYPTYAIAIATAAAVCATRHQPNLR